MRSEKFGKRLTFEARGLSMVAAGRTRREYELQGYRPPRKGEFYVSGAIPAAYVAPNDLGDSYWVVRPLGAPLGEIEKCPNCGQVCS